MRWGDDLNDFVIDEETEATQSNDVNNNNTWLVTAMNKSVRRIPNGPGHVGPIWGTTQCAPFLVASASRQNGMAPTFARNPLLISGPTCVIVQR